MDCCESYKLFHFHIGGLISAGRDCSKTPRRRSGTRAGLRRSKRQSSQSGQNAMSSDDLTVRRGCTGVCENNIRGRRSELCTCTGSSCSSEHAQNAVPRWLAVAVPMDEITFSALPLRSPRSFIRTDNCILGAPQEPLIKALHIELKSQDAVLWAWPAALIDILAVRGGLMSSALGEPLPASMHNRDHQSLTQTV